MDTVLVAGLGSAIALVGVMVLSVIGWRRIWPPGDDTRSWLFYWVLATTNTIAIAVLAVRAIGSVDIWLPVRVGGGLVLMTGLVLFIVAALQLGAGRTSGRPGALRRSELYARTRNPQVLSNLIILAGLAVLIPVRELLVVIAVTAVWLVLMVRAEERWLLEVHGESYRRYMQAVPRFVGRRTFGMARD